MSKLSKPTVSPLPPGAVIVTEHKEAHAARLLWWADQFSTWHELWAPHAAKELRAAADYVERLEAAEKNCINELNQRSHELLHRAEQAEQEAQALRAERDAAQASWATAARHIRQYRDLLGVGPDDNGLVALTTLRAERDRLKERLWYWDMHEPDCDRVYNTDCSCGALQRELAKQSGKK